MGKHEAQETDMTKGTTRATPPPSGYSHTADASESMNQPAGPVPYEPVPVKTGAALGWTRKKGFSLRVADLIDELAQRVTLLLPESAVVRRDVKRYYAAIEAEAGLLDWSPAEWALARRALAGNTFDRPKRVRMMWAYAAEELGLDHGVTATLRHAPLIQLYAILDRLESMNPDADGTVPATVPSPVAVALVAEPVAAAYAVTPGGA